MNRQLIALSICLASISPAFSADAMRHYTAEYRLYLRGVLLSVVDLHLSLSDTAYRLSAHIGPAGIGHILSDSHVVTTTKGPRSFDTPGENFACGPDGAAWRREDGPGMLVIGVPTFDSRVPGGDLASSFRIADAEEACIHLCATGNPACNVSHLSHGARAFDGCSASQNIPHSKSRIAM